MAGDMGNDLGGALDFSRYKRRVESALREGRLGSREIVRAFREYRVRDAFDAAEPPELFARRVLADR
jgi:hypothetical protein